MNIHPFNISVLLCALVLSLTVNANAESHRLATIKARGELIVGVKADYPPMGLL